MSGSVWAGGGIVPVLSQVEIISVQCSDMVSNISIQVGAGYFRVKKAFIISAISASLFVVSSSGVVTLDINKNGSTILSTKLTLDANEKISETAAIPYVLTDTGAAFNDEFTIDIDTAGTGARGVIVYFLGNYLYG